MTAILSDSYGPSNLESLSESQFREHLQRLSEELTAFIPSLMTIAASAADTDLQH